METVGSFFTADKGDPMRPKVAGLALPELLVFLVITSMIFAAATRLLTIELERLSREREHQQRQVQLALMCAELGRSWERRARHEAVGQYAIQLDGAQGDVLSRVRLLQFPYHSVEGLRLMRLREVETGWVLTVEPLQSVGPSRERVIQGIGRIMCRSAIPGESFPQAIILGFPDFKTRPHLEFALW
jgi:type II secretory pathway component PulJ